MISKFKTILFSAFLLLIGSSDIPAMPIGHWNDYYSYYSTIAVAVVEDKVYFAAENGLFFIPKGENATYKFNTIQGLSEVGISSMTHDTYSKTTVIGYQNGNIDLIQGNRVYNMPDIKRKEIEGSKKINRIVVIDKGYAYLCCDFGIVLLNMNRNEISETYIIGENHTYLGIYDVTLSDSAIYAATQKGLLTANRFSNKLNDFSEWSAEPFFSSNKKFKLVGYFEDQLFACSFGDNEQDTTWCLKDENWAVFDTNPCSQLRVSKEKLLHLRQLSGRFQIDIYDRNMQLEQTYGNNPGDASFRSMTDAELDWNNEIWISTSTSGGFRFTANFDRLFQYLPSGPATNQIYSLSHSQNALYFCSGTIENWAGAYRPFHVERYRNGSWESFTREKSGVIQETYDPLSVVENPLNPDEFFTATWTRGLVRINTADNTYVNYTDENSTLQWVVGYAIRTGDIGFDRNNNLWISNSLVPNTISKMTPSGEWKAFQLEHLIGGGDNVKEVLVDWHGQVWLRNGEGKLIIFREQNNVSEALKANLNRGNDHSTAILNCMVEDVKGYIWIGTEKGIKVNYTSRRVFDNPIGNESSIEFNTIIHDGRPLLENESITAIAVDGGDRKWIGTSSSGVFLISDNGKSKLQQFNVLNSPLNSNNITDIAINPKTGEVFIATDKGLMSFQGDATEASQTTQDVVIFPNPVRGNFNGEIAIRGLVENAYVRITDVSGNLIHETQANGGMATWNGLTRQGQRVKPGVYMVFSTDAEGTVTDVNKIFITK